MEITLIFSQIESREENDMHGQLFKKAQMFVNPL